MVRLRFRSKIAARAFVDDTPVSPPRDVVVWVLMGLMIVPPLPPAEVREKREALTEVEGELMEALEAEYTEARFRTPCAL